jgi:glycosyltransferase involved in cell wall biosynthesis
MPRVAVCVCTSNRAPLLGRVLGVIERIELGELAAKDIAVLVVDNRPEDGRARAVCEGLAPKLPMPLVVVDEPTPGISFARNRAVAEARALGADFVAFVDDDDIPRPDWLWRLVSRQRETGADMVFGSWRLPDSPQTPRWLERTRYFRPPRPDDRNRFGLPGWAGAYNVLLSRPLLDRLAEEGDVFRAEFAHCGGEDGDLFIRANRAGAAHACAHDSVVVRAWEPHRMTLRGVLRRGFLLGGSRARLARAHLPAAQARGLARASWRKLGKAVLGLPAAGWRRAPAADALVKLAGSLGEIHAWAGLRYGYYQRRRG